MYLFENPTLDMAVALFCYRPRSATDDSASSSRPSIETGSTGTAVQNRTVLWTIKKKKLPKHTKSEAPRLIYGGSDDFPTTHERQKNPLVINIFIFNETRAKVPRDNSTVVVYICHHPANDDHPIARRKDLMPVQNWRKPGLMIAAIAFFLSFSTEVSAQSINDSFRLGMETRLFRFLSSTAEPEESGFEDDNESIEFGIFSFGSVFSKKIILLGAPASSFGADLAYGLSGNVLLGSHLMLDYMSVKDGADLSVVQFAIVPHLDYVFLTGRKFRPFLGLQLGGQFASLSEGNADTSGKVFMLGAELGAFGFVTNSLSIDPRLSFLYSFGGAEITGVDWDVNSISIAIMLGISGWM